MDLTFRYTYHFLGLGASSLYLEKLSRIDCFNCICNICNVHYIGKLCVFFLNLLKVISGIEEGPPVLDSLCLFQVFSKTSSLGKLAP